MKLQDDCKHRTYFEHLPWTGHSLCTRTKRHGTSVPTVNFLNESPPGLFHPAALGPSHKQGTRLCAVPPWRHPLATLLPLDLAEDGSGNAVRISCKCRLSGLQVWSWGARALVPVKAPFLVPSNVLNTQLFDAALWVNERASGCKGAYRYLSLTCKEGQLWLAFNNMLWDSCSKSQSVPFCPQHGKDGRKLSRFEQQCLPPEHLATLQSFISPAFSSLLFTSF